MKRIYILLIIGMLVGIMMPNPVKAIDDYIVHGTVYNSDSTVEPYAFVQLTNTRTSDILDTQANGDGHFVINCANFSNGYQDGDFCKLRSTSLNGLWTSYPANFYIDTDYLSIQIDSMLPPALSPTFQTVYVCDMNTYHRLPSLDTWFWEEDVQTDWRNNNLNGIEVQMSYQAHDKGDDSQWPTPPPNLKIHVHIDWVLWADKYEDGVYAGEPVQDSESTNYNLSYGELYYWDPYLTIKLRNTWNGHNVEVSGWIDINWTDWYGRLYNGEINAEFGNYTFYW